MLPPEERSAQEEDPPEKSYAARGWSAENGCSIRRSTAGPAEMIDCRRCEDKTMAVVRLEAKKDPLTDLYYLEIYNPADSDQPFVTTEPRYKSAAAAENDIIAIIATRANKRPNASRQSAGHTW
jgi:hypothetical protein